MHEFGHLFYTKFYEADLRLFIEHDLSKHAQRLYLFYGLNWHTYTEFTEPLTDQEIADKLGTHRTTIMRARAELEDAGLIVPDELTITQAHSYHLPHRAKVDSHAAKQKKENVQKQQEQEFAKRRTIVEDALNRRLHPPELLALKRKFGLV